MSRVRPIVAFVADRKDCARWPDIDALTPADVDRQQQRFRSGIDVWIAQSYVLLRDALAARGYTVRFGHRYPWHGIGVAHWDDLNALFNGAHRAHVIGVRADRSRLDSCERVVVQNDVGPVAPCERYVPLWPQPGLQARDAARGTRVATVGYFGRMGRVPAWMRGGELAARLAALGVALKLSDDAWNDYRDVDVVLAVRTEGAAMLRQKPASKLYNAWLAGVPALLSPEPAFARLRASELDYVEVRNADDVVAAVQQLQRDPATYAAMVARGRERGAAFTRDAIAARWLAVIDEVRAAGAALPSLVGFVRAVNAQRREARRFRAQHAAEQAAMPL
ncbi:MAG: glycosyltransferase family 1 protein [Proteobacteria bacterium]|nr:glycosyltransferase family 1 protein [Pseudomonadota bacterium]